MPLTKSRMDDSYYGIETNLALTKSKITITECYYYDQQILTRFEIALASDEDSPINFQLTGRDRHIMLTGVPTTEVYTQR